MTWPRRRYRTYVLGAGGLNYDPLSYSQNFDDGKVCECEPDFMARYALAQLAGLPGQAEAPSNPSPRPAQVSGMKSHGGKGSRRASQPPSLHSRGLPAAARMRDEVGGEDMGYMYNFNSKYVHMYLHLHGYTKYVPTNLLHEVPS